MSNKRFLTAVLILVLALPLTAAEWTTPAPKKEGAVAAQEALSVLWEGLTDLDMLHQVRLDLARAREEKKTLSVTLLSPGGPIITSIEIGRQIWLARQKGQVVEIHGVGLVASGATLVLASGTKGKRFISEHALVVVHPIQSRGFMSSQCVTFSEQPKDEGERVANAIMVIMRNVYMKFTEKSQGEVEKWLTCGNEQAGGGALAVTLGMADAVRE